MSRQLRISFPENFGFILEINTQLIKTSNETHLDELCTHVPPRSMRVPVEGGAAEPLGDAVDDPSMDTESWFRDATVLASSYVVPPIINTITSCGLQTYGHKCISWSRPTVRRAFVVMSLGQPPVAPLQRDSSCPSADLARDVPMSGISVERAECIHSPRPDIHP